jgi:hypothetical protein
MKKVLVAATALICCVSGGTAFAQAPMLGMGTQEIGASGSIDFDDPGGDVSLNISGSYGYFIQDNVEIGARAGFLRQNGGDIDEIDLGGFGEFHFPVSNITVPYVGVDLNFSYTDIDPGGSEDAFVLSPKVGVKWFVRDYVAIDTNIFFKWATEDLYLNDGRLEDTDWGALLGLRVYFK